MVIMSAKKKKKKEKKQDTYAVKTGLELCNLALHAAHELEMRQISEIFIFVGVCNRFGGEFGLQPREIHIFLVKVFCM